MILKNDTGVDLGVLHGAIERFNKLYTDMGTYAPMITTNGLTSRLNRSDFNKYLNSAKAKEYNVLKKFIQASKDLKTVGMGEGEMHLLRFANGYLSFDDSGQLQIENSQFIE